MTRSLIAIFMLAGICLNGQAQTNEITANGPVNIAITSPTSNWTTDIDLNVDVPTPVCPTCPQVTNCASCAACTNCLPCPACSNTVVIGYPPGPTNLVVTWVGSNSATISWANQSSPLNIVVTRNNLIIATLSNNITSYFDTGLSPGTTYTWKLWAGFPDTVVSGMTSNAPTPPVAVLQPPTGVTATSGVGSFTLNWASLGTQAGFYIRTNCNACQPYPTIPYWLCGQTPSNQFTYTQSNLPSGKTYLVVVGAHDNSTNELDSVPVSVVTQ